MAEHRQGQRQALLFTLTFAVSARNGGEACNLQSANNIALVKLESSSLDDNLVIQLKERSRHKLIRDRDSGQIEALDRDYVKSSSASLPAPDSSAGFSRPDLY